MPKFWNYFWIRQNNWGPVCKGGVHNIVNGLYLIVFMILSPSQCQQSTFTAKTDHNKMVKKLNKAASLLGLNDWAVAPESHLPVGSLTDVL